jgi:hypothetical protein
MTYASMHAALTQARRSLRRKTTFSRESAGTGRVPALVSSPLTSRDCQHNVHVHMCVGVYKWRVRTHKKERASMSMQRRKGERSKQYN